MEDFTDRARFLATELGVPSEWLRIKASMEQTYRSGLLAAADAVLKHGQPPTDGDDSVEWADLSLGEVAFLRTKIHALGV
ncbi:MAG: hypothetical protein WCO84_06970 [bacterium]